MFVLSSDFPRSFPGVVEDGMYTLWPFEAVFSWKKSVSDIGLSVLFLDTLLWSSSFGRLCSSSLRLSLLAGVELNLGPITYQFELIGFEIRGAGPGARPRRRQLDGSGDAGSSGPGHCVGVYFDLG